MPAQDHAPDAPMVARSDLLGDAARPPLVILSLAAVTWSFRLVGRTRMLTEAWVRRGQATVFVQVPSLRTAAQRLLWLPRWEGGVAVVRPWPAYPSRWWAWLGRERVESGMRRRAALLRRQLDSLVPWDRTVAVVVSPVWTPWLDELPLRHVVYDCIDELAVHVPRPELMGWYRTWEERLVARASGAVVTAEQLGASLRARRPDLPVALIRNGVDADRFQSLAAATPRPADVPLADRPVVGFVGALYDWIDWELIRETALLLPQFDFVFVGPHDRRGQPRRIASLPNVRLLGVRPYQRVPAYVDTFTVGWVPFKPGPVGAAANPVKIYEYLALGKPVVSTPVADLESFEGLVMVARTATEMAERLRAAVSGGADDAVARIQFARRHTWDARAGQYVDFLASLLRAESAGGGGSQDKAKAS